MYAQQNLKQPLLDDVDRHLVQQRNDDMRQIAQDLSDLKDTMSQINSLVGEQGEDLSIVDTNTANAAAHVDSGHEEVKLASKYQSSYRKKVFIIILIVIILTVIIILIILGATGVFGKKPEVGPPK